MNHQGKPITILLIEDDEVDREAFQYSFEKARIANPIHYVGDGKEALRLLRGEGCDPLSKPYMIVLDINLPRMNGHEFLDELRKDPELKGSIVFVLTTSDSEGDKLAAYNKNVAGYMLKSRVGEQFLRLTELFDHYWRIIEFPPPR